MSNKTKYLVTLVTAISAGGVLFTTGYEGWSSKPYPDTGNVISQGFGSTVKPDGSKIKMSDAPITKKQGIEYLAAHYSKDAKFFNKTLAGIKLSQDEYDLYADFAYQFGTGAWSSSSMLKNLKAGKYVQACKSLEAWRFSRVKGVKVDCRLKGSGCAGVWNRQKARIDKCLGANT
ncbi:glycoside hydrolase family protein [Acinetobacter ursingii]|uniref:glycoside hydrolase family protein n=1 Tax=Acinetobacter ursingii TaxID=108980 RepID=UPI0021CD60BA|nr:glycoside hydrolase family protein [Acinetobacter ursingii]MCU4483919.1 glycoside hydrolase family protein [Acinetobacter ursingii]MCU4508172.1 glycoside hydrolase family protein [Acinetobacter ursingii]